MKHARFLPIGGPLALCTFAVAAASPPRDAAGHPNATARPRALPAHPGEIERVSQTPRRLLVRFKSGVGPAAQQASRRRSGVDRVLREYRVVNRLQLLEVRPERLEAALHALRNDSNVLYAERDRLVYLNETPNDPFFDLQWGLLNTGQEVSGTPGVPGADIGATLAWDLWTGDPDFRIAVIDTGVDYTHPDLVDNMWVNPGETPGNGIDDDGNGYVDDVHGYDFFNDDGDPMDDYSHGTHVAGIIGAVADNGTGVAGVNWRCKIVALKLIGAEGNGPVSAAIAALDYAVANDITLSNNSWGSSDPLEGDALRDTIAAAGAAGHLFVASAGNDGADNDLQPYFPSGLDLDNIIAVAATDNLDQLRASSNYGITAVDLGAPGTHILSAAPGAGYIYLTGTSMAAPHVTGVTALLMTLHPEMEWWNVRERVLRSARPVDALFERTVTGGVVDAAAALEDCNRNGQRDDLDIATEVSQDCSGNGVPDECERDCNRNGRADSCDVLLGSSVDCTSNGIPDECEDDCNHNGVLDSCDIESGALTDANADLRPDECYSACCLCEGWGPCEYATSDEACAARNGVSGGVGSFCEDGCGTPLPERCEDRLMLPSTVEFRLPISNGCAGNHGPDLNPVCLAGRRVAAGDLWFEYVAPCTGAVTIGVCDNLDHDVVLSAYSDGSVCTCPENNDHLVACEDSFCAPLGARIDGLPVTEDQCLLIRVAGVPVGIGAARASNVLDISMDCLCDEALTDKCPGAVRLPGELHVEEPVDTSGLCLESDGPNPTPDCNGSAPTIMADQWYQYKAPCCGNASIRMVDADFDAVTAVYATVPSCRCPTTHDGLITCLDGAAEGTTPVTTDDCLAIRVGGRGDVPRGRGTLRVDVTCDPVPCLPPGRYLSVVPEDKGAMVAWRVEFESLESPFDVLEGQGRWVGGTRIVQDGATALVVAELQCDPVYRDWGPDGLIHLYGDAVLPTGVYHLRAVPPGCVLGDPCDADQGLTIGTGVLGDVVEPFAGEASVQPDFLDIAAVVRTFTGALAAPGLVTADVYPNVPDQIVDFRDISTTVGSFVHAPYPFAGPAPCP